MFVFVLGFSYVMICVREWCTFYHVFYSFGEFSVVYEVVGFALFLFDFISFGIFLCFSSRFLAFPMDKMV